MLTGGQKEKRRTVIRTNNEKPNNNPNSTISVLACPKIIGDLCIVERVRQALIEALPRKPLALGKAQTSFGSSLADAVFDILEQVMYTHIKIRNVGFIRIMCFSWQ